MAFLLNACASGLFVKGNQEASIKELLRTIDACHKNLLGDDYKKLEGMSIARGFNAKVKELFAGSRGCTHITALLSAMAPVAIQTGWSMRVTVMNEGESQSNPSDAEIEQREKQLAGTINTCHMWDESGELAAQVRAGEAIEIPLSVRKRFQELGRPEVWGVV
jgi:hypothetical protein